MMAKESLKYWTILFLGLFYISIECDARAVNMSNTWTMPQEGLNVFYRFFRDRISWFEADAVCQFHHANLVTVDNSFQFDATRDLLRELDVNDIVWIGLMRPQSSDRFMWSNSRPLASDTGYWAESLPLMDAPLCSVIDPIRDYRWHALRCGGPETASFLCEMQVPSWADNCILREIPSLTMQYMADTATIELIRNCNEEGLVRQTCKGKQDRERVVRELICPKERRETEKLNGITNSHFKSLQIINSIATDNNENNDIELTPMKHSLALSTDSPHSLTFSELTEQAQTEKNTVQKLIEQFNVDELMQADDPESTIAGQMHIPGEIPKPVKKGAKKVITAIMKKDKAHTSATPKPKSVGKPTKEYIPLEDMMMGDQPMHDHHNIPLEISDVNGDDEDDDDVSNEIVQPLPHIKKVLPQDLKTMPPIVERNQHKQMQLLFNTEVVTSTTTPGTIIPSEDDAPSLRYTSPPIVLSTLHTLPIHATDEQRPFAGSEFNLFTTPVPTTIEHPIHPKQQQHTIGYEEETSHQQHVKESNDNGHFIPPMLLVKSHYIPPTKIHEHEHSIGNEHEKEHEHVVRTASSYHRNDENRPLQPHSGTQEITATPTKGGLETLALPIKPHNHTLPTTSEIFAANNIAATKSTTATGAEPQPAMIATSSATLPIPTNSSMDIQQTTIIRSDVGGSSSTAMMSPRTTEKITIHSVNDETTTTTHNAIIVADNDEASSKTQNSMQTSTVSETQNTKLVIPVVEQNYRMDAANTSPSHLGFPTSSSSSSSSAGEQMQATTATNTMGVAATLTTISTTRIASMPSFQDRKQSHITVTLEEKLHTTAAAVTPTILFNTQKPVEHISNNRDSIVPLATTSILKTTSASDQQRQQQIIYTSPVAINEHNHIPTTTTITAIPTKPISITAHPTRNFLKEETYAPFKPNRRRSLTKPESISYIKKILG